MANLEKHGEVISFADRVERARLAAERGVLSNHLSEALPAAVQLVAFDDTDEVTDPKVEAMWVDRHQERLAA